MLALSLNVFYDHEHFHDNDIVVKNKVNVVFPFVVDSLSCASWIHNILTTVMVHTIVYKSIRVHTVPT